MSEIVYTSIMEIKQLSKQHGCKVSRGKPLNWIISSVELYNWVFCQENTEEKLENNQKKL